MNNLSQKFLNIYVKPKYNAGVIIYYKILKENLKDVKISNLLFSKEKYYSRKPINITNI